MQVEALDPGVDGVQHVERTERPHREAGWAKRVLVVAGRVALHADLARAGPGREAPQHLLGRVVRGRRGGPGQIYRG